MTPGLPPARRTAVLLDLDKTLVNVEDGIDYCGGSPSSARCSRARSGTSGSRRPEADGPDRSSGFLGALAGRPEWPSASAIVERFEVASVGRSVVMAGLADLLAVINPARTAIVTLLGPAATSATIARHLSVRPAVVVARDPAPRPKPAPDQALRRLGASPAEAVMVGDSEVDEATARAAGIRFIGVTNGRRDHRCGPETVVLADLWDVATRLVE